MTTDGDMKDAEGGEGVALLLVILLVTVGVAFVAMGLSGDATAAGTSATPPTQTARGPR